MRYITSNKAIVSKKKSIAKAAASALKPRTGRLYESCESCTKETSHLSSYVQSAFRLCLGGHVADRCFLLARLRVGVRKDALGFQPPAGLFEGPCLNATQCQLCVYGSSTSSAMSLRHASQREQLLVLLVQSSGPFHVPSVRLERICYSCQSEAAVEAPVPDTFPSLLLVLLARLDAKEPARRGIVAWAVATLSTLGLRERPAEGQRKLEVGLACRDGGRGARGGAERGERRHWVPRVRAPCAVSGDV
jgi:hypothetical protein